MSRCNRGRGGRLGCLKEAKHQLLLLFPLWGTGKKMPSSREVATQGLVRQVCEQRNSHSRHALSKEPGLGERWGRCRGAGGCTPAEFCGSPMAHVSQIVEQGRHRATRWFSVHFTFRTKSVSLGQRSHPCHGAGAMQRLQLCPHLKAGPSQGWGSVLLLTSLII